MIIFWPYFFIFSSPASSYFFASLVSSWPDAFCFHSKNLNLRLTLNSNLSQNLKMRTIISSVFHVFCLEYDIYVSCSCFYPFSDFKTNFLFCGVCLIFFSFLPNFLVYRFYIHVLCVLPYHTYNNYRFWEVSHQRSFSSLQLSFCH